MRHAMRCSSCDSEDVKRLEVVYEEGLYTEDSDVDLVSGGVSRSYGGGQQSVSFGGGATSGTIRTTGMSAAAEKAAPPAKRTPLRTAFWRAVGAVVGGFAAGVAVQIATDNSDLGAFTWVATTLGLMILVVRSMLASMRFNRMEYPQLFGSWQRSWRCSRCGEIFEAAKAA